MTFSKTSGAGLDVLIKTLLVTVLALSAPIVQGKPLNIVFILTDNQAASALSIYGNRDVRTPHIDALASNGVTYDNAYAVSGMCSPTRATLMTGLMPSQHGLHNALFDPWVDEMAPGWNAVAEFRTVPYTLAQHGFQTAMIGKWHLGDTRQPSIGFQHWVALPYGHTKDFWDNELIENGERYPVEDQHIVDALTGKAVEYLTRVDTEQPFYLQLNLDGPYALPPSNYGVARNRFYPDYAGLTYQSMPTEPVSDHILGQLNGPWQAGELESIGDLDAVWDYLRYGTIRMQGDPQSYANFLSQNAVVDDAVGRVVTALEKQGLLDNTVIIYSADQGNLYGQHGSWGHTIWFTPAELYQTMMGVPLVVQHPQGAKGVRSQQLVAQYDIPATMLDFAGIKPDVLENSPGKSFAASLSGAEIVDDERAVFFEQEESRGLRTQRYAYWKHLDDMDTPKLFDMHRDPGQQNNLYPSMKESELVEKLDGMLLAHFKTYSSPQYDLWGRGVHKGTSPKAGMWIKRNIWGSIKKYWKDFVIKDPGTGVYSD